MMWGVVRYQPTIPAEAPYKVFRRTIATVQTTKQASAMDALVMKLGEVGAHGLIPIGKTVEKLSDDIWELRPKPFRILFFFDKQAQHYVLLQGFRKKSQKTPAGEIDRAERMRLDYYARKDQGEIPWQIQN